MGLLFALIESNYLNKPLSALHLLAPQIDQTKAACDLVCSPIVFSHNDLLSGNILIVERPGGLANTNADLSSSMQFIDYEYSACGYR